MPSFERELAVRGKINELPRIIEFVEECCAAAGVDEDYRFDVVLAVEEGCSNVFEHAYDGRGGELEVNFCTEGTDLAVTLRDRGRTFDPSSVQKPDMTMPLEDRPVGGLGMHLMYRLLDDVRYTFGPDGNALHLVKRGIVHRPSEGAPPEGSNG